MTFSLYALKHVLKAHSFLQVISVLTYLEEELKLSKDDVKKIIDKFPEVMNLSVERRLKANLEHMQKVSP